jgi:hypothetical protein
MPYEIRKVNNKDGAQYCVYKESGGPSLGCHSSREKAQSQIDAIYANESAQKAQNEFTPRLAVLVTSNAYEDRQRETVRQKALEGYVERAWKEDAFIGDNPLLIWHGGDPIGDIVYADTEGPFLIEVAREKPDGPVNLARRGEAPVTTTVKSVWDALENSDIEWGASHEFLYAVKDREDGIYDDILKLETSVLPRANAANGYTFFAVIGDNHE